MAGLEPSSVHAIVTDSPYELGFMGKGWDKSGISYNVEVWREALRVLRPGGYLLAFGGSRTYHRLACAIEDAGFEVRDQIMWVYGSGFPKSKNIGGGLGTALKPAHEPICVARKPLDGTVAENVAKWGVGAMDIDGCRVRGDKGNGVWGSSNKTCQDWRIFNASPEGEGYRSAAHDLGRWPANLIHDGGEEVLALFPVAPGQAGPCSDNQRTRANCYGALRRGGKQYEPRADSGSAARFFYCAKTSRKEREVGLEGMEKRTLSTMSGGEFPADKSGRTHNTTGNPNHHLAHNHHPTVKPVALMEYLVRLVSRSGQTVLDPFMGSGTTGIACANVGREFIGIEKEPEYVEIARRRIYGPLYQETVKGDYPALS